MMLSQRIADALRVVPGDTVRLKIMRVFRDLRDLSSLVPIEYQPVRDPLPGRAVRINLSREVVEFFTEIGDGHLQSGVYRSALRWHELQVSGAFLYLKASK